MTSIVDPEGYEVDVLRRLVSFRDMSVLDVGDVLQKVHRWLRPRGLLINLQPYAKPMQVEVRVGNDRRAVGTAQDSVDKLSDMREALRRVDEMVAAGLFALRDRANWRLQTEYPSEEDWKGFAEKPTCGGIEADPQQLDEAFARPDSCVILTEDNLASIYERLE